MMDLPTPAKSLRKGNTWLIWLLRIDEPQPNLLEYLRAVVQRGYERGRRSSGRGEQVGGMVQWSFREMFVSFRRMSAIDTVTTRNWKRDPYGIALYFHD